MVPFMDIQCMNGIFQRKICDSFLFYSPNIRDFGYSLQTPQGGSSNKHPQSMFRVKEYVMSPKTHFVLDEYCSSGVLAAWAY